MLLLLLAVFLTITPAPPWQVQSGEQSEETTAAEGLQQRALAEVDALRTSLGECRTKGEAARAREQAIEALRILLEQPDAEPVIVRLDHLGHDLAGLDDYASARDAWERVSQYYARELGGESETVISVRANLAVALKKVGEYERAVELQEAAVAAMTRAHGAEHLKTMEQAENLATTLLSIGELDRAEDLLREVLRVREGALPAGDVMILRALGNLAILLDARGDLNGALEAQARVVEQLEQTLPEDDPRLALQRMNLGATLMNLGRSLDARALLERVIETYERTLPATSPNLIGARMNLASVLTILGDFEGAIELQREVIAALEAGGSAPPVQVLMARQNLAMDLSMAGEHARARALLEELVTEYERVLQPRDPSLLNARTNLATLAGTLGDPVAEMRGLEELLEIRETFQEPEHPDLVSTRFNLAAARLGLGDLAGARALFEQVLATRLEHYPEDRSGLLSCRLNLAMTALAMGDRSATSVLEQVVAGYREAFPDGHPHERAARVGLADVLRDQGRLDEARATLEAVEAEHARLPSDHPDLLECRYNLATVMWESGDTAAAIAILERLWSSLEHMPLEDDPERMQVLSQLVLLQHDVERPDAVRARLDRLLDSMFLRLELCLMRSPREAREIAHSEEGRLQRMLQWSALRPESPELARDVFELVETQRHVSLAPLAGLEARDPELAPAWAEALALRNRAAAGRSRELLVRRDRIEASIRDRLVELGVLRARIRLAPLAAALPRDAVAVGYRSYRAPVSPERPNGDVEERLLAHVVRPDGRLQRLELGTTAALNESVRAWRAAIGYPLRRGVAVSAVTPPSEVTAGEALRRLVLDPVLELLEDGEGERIVVCLDGALHLVALDALPLGGELVGDRHAIHLAVSFDGLLRAPPPVDEGPLLALGGIDFYAPLAGMDDVAAEEHGVDLSGSGDDRLRCSPLPESRGEVLGLGELYASTFEREAIVLTGEAASKFEFHEHAPGARWLHLATHGLFAPDAIPSSTDPSARWSPVHGLAPMSLCGLALAGVNRGQDSLGRTPGFLTAEELAGVDLSACYLAVLSACETNVGIRRAGQGIQSLQGALHTAGARCVVTSLWKVGDEAARTLMADFYARLWAEGEPVERALWKAKTALRRARDPEGRPRFRSADFAGWVLSGAPLE